MRGRGWRHGLITTCFAVLMTLIVGVAGVVSAASASQSRSRLFVVVSGLPPAQPPAVVVHGPGTNWTLAAQRLALSGLKPGKYFVTMRALRIRHGWRSVKAGARVFPKINRVVVRVRRGRTTTVDAVYGTIVNPGVTKLPRGVLAVVGDPLSPTGLVYGNQGSVPAVGAVVVTGPSTLLPYGLIAEIKSTHRSGERRTVSIANVPLTAAVPEFSFSGTINLKPAPGAAASARTAAAKSTCDGPKTFNVGASLDQFQIRRASASLFPAEMSVEVAARTTEHAGANLLAIDVSCNWTVATIGPWRAEIPTPVVPIPVYAQVPLTASADIGGSISAFRINLASTHDMTLSLGHYNHFSLQEQGSNVWTSGVLTWSGQADLGMKLAVQFGIGDPKLGNFHLEVGVGAQAAFNTNESCEVDFIPGSLDAGVKVGPFSGSTTLWSAKQYPLWKGCKGSGSGGGGGGTVTLQNPGAQTNPAGTLLSVQMHATDTAQGSLTYSATGLPPGLSIDATTGLISGTPTTVGSYTTSVVAHDSTGPRAQQDFEWTITAGAAQVHATAIAATGWSACARLASGGVNCWGSGDLGTGTAAGSTVPAAVAGLENAAQVGGTCATADTGAIKCWGNSSTGALGNGTTSGPDFCVNLGVGYPCSTTPVTVSGITNATQVSSNGSDACAVLSSGGVECWGYNGDGELGDNSTAGPDSCSNLSPSIASCSATPVSVTGITNAVQVSVGSGFVCALLSSGEVKCWGVNEEGELGNGTDNGPDACQPGGASDCNDAPGTVLGITNAVQVSAGALSACAVLATGDVRCWGNNAYGQLGNGTIGGAGFCGNGDYCELSPVGVNGLTGASQVAVGGGVGDACALLTTGAIRCWGYNANGQLGDGATDGPDTCAYYGDVKCSSNPVSVSGINGATQIAAGTTFECALISGGQVDCWGYNEYGQLGNGTATDSDLPVQVSAFQ